MIGEASPFSDQSAPTVGAVMRRDEVEIRTQLLAEMSFTVDGDTNNLRFLIDDVDALFAELATQSLFDDRTTLGDTQWSAREFALYDPDRSGLALYRDL